MTLNIHLPENTVMKPEITVFGVGGAGGNATNNMIKENLEGVNFVVANTDAQSLENSAAQKRIQLGQHTTQGLGAGASPDVGAEAAEEAMDEIVEHLTGSNMVFITAGMGGGTGTGAAPVIARAAREHGILTVGVVTKPFHFEGPRRMKLAEEGLEELQKHVDTLIVIPNQNLFRIANEKTTFADAFKLADNVLHRGVRGVTDLMIMPGLINLDFADVKAVMGEMGKAMMGTGEAEGERRAQDAAEAAISNPLLDNISMKGAQGVLINITGGPDMTLFEVDEAANRVREEVDSTANIIFGSTFNEELEGKIRVSVVATGIDLVNTGTVPNKAFSSAKPEEETIDKVVEDKLLDEQVSAGDECSEESEATSEEVSVDNAESAESEDNTSTEDGEPSTVDEQYYAAIKKLNDEYDEKVATESPVEGEEGDGVFVSSAPMQPDDYISSDFGAIPANNEENEAVSSEDSDSSEEAVIEKPSGGLFSRMAKVARGFQSSESREAQQPQEEEAQVSDEEVSVESSESKTEDDLVDIPAFLRRKA